MTTLDIGQEVLNRQPSDLPVPTEAERHQLLVEWNDTPIGYPMGTCIHELFEAQVAQTPDAVAVVFEDQHLSYQELNRRSNQLAHHLWALGVEPEVRVGICTERSLEMVIGLLGILKAGGAYVPLDPRYPPERLALIVQDCHPRILLTSHSLMACGLEQVLPSNEAQIVLLDANRPAISQGNDTHTVNRVTSENLAYVIYTSGSTGRPKGVQISHHAVVNFLNAMRRQPGLIQDDILLAVTTLSFDMAGLEMYLPLMVGARLVLASHTTISDGELLGAFLTESAATVLQATPTSWRLLIDAGWSGSKQFKALCGGEPLPRELANKLLDRQVSLWHMYGPTETTVWSTTCLIDSMEGLISLGQPIANTQLYILDSHLQPVPPGVPGELYIGGCGLSRGYLNRADLTASSFIPDPFSGEAGTRLYKTGDRVRYWPNRTIEFLGRVDHQIKIRGFRIEPGEIEALLGQYPGLDQVFVTTHQDGAGETRLIAYYVTRQAPPQARDLRLFLKHKLPDYMIPAAFQALDSVPLTPTGKVDRKALPAIAPIRLASGGILAPRTPTEEVLANIWSQVLDSEQVGVHDNFFELGGHSLLVTRIMSRVRDIFRVELPLQQLFAAPTIAALAEGIEIALQEGQRSQIPPIRRAVQDRDSLFGIGVPASFAQQRLWFLDQLEPGNPAYHIAMAMAIAGPLNVAILARSLGEILQRHEALRATFRPVDGQPVQVITPTLPISLLVADLRDLPAEEQAAEVKRLIAEEAKRPFDLATGPLFRATLLKLRTGDQGIELDIPRLGTRNPEHMLLITMHHIISDNWSIGVFNRELATLYETFSNDRPSPLVELPIQYADFAAWQREWLQGEVLQAQFAYWKRQLGGDLPVLELPLDHPRSKTLAFWGDRHPFTLPQIVAKAIRALSRQEGVTLFMVLLAAFKVLLHRYTGQEDIMVGSVIANRNYAEVEDVIGFFVNTLVLRTDLSGDPTFRELLGRTREMCLEAYAHQDLPFEYVVKELQPKRDTTSNPLFQVMFTLQNAPMLAPELPSLSTNLQEIYSGTAQFDLSLEMWETPQGLAGYFEYNIDLFDTSTIARMAEHFQVLLGGITAQNGAERRLSQLPLLTEAERYQVLVEWNNLSAEITARADMIQASHQCIQHLFETWVEHNPDAIATAFETEHLSYRELDARANQLAHYLQKLGVGPEVPVGICLERSFEMLVSILGVLKAGGAYVPLDPASPQERLAFMLADSRAGVVLTQEKLITSLPLTPTSESKSSLIVCLDRDWAAIAKESEKKPTNEATTENLAYVIYTSGSTGQPKGVQITHKSLLNYSSSECDVLAIEPGDRVLQFAAVDFDSAVDEIFSSLSGGATLVLRTEDMLDSVPAFLHKCRDWGVTVLDLVTAYWHEITAQLSAGNLTLPSHLRVFYTGGERMLPERLAEWHNCVGTRVRLLNGYGPTETTVVATLCDLSDSAETGTGAREVSIGRPIRNVQAYVLDRYLNPVPIGVPGELYIGGDGLARGYRNRPELTAEVFIPNPFNGTHSQSNYRLYKTGDRARYLPDGNLEYLGRVDYQVKIRSFRVELGEIEAMLSQHPAVQETVILLSNTQHLTGTSSPQDAYLVAYIVPVRGQSPAISDLRRFLREKLPDYMIPSAFVLLEAIPLTPRGKVDRQALPLPDRSQPELDKTMTAPRTPAEEKLSKIWAELLGFEQIGVYDNFFELGGHSLLATRLISRLREAFHIELALRLLFELPTVASLAKHIEVVQWAAHSTQILPASPSDGRTRGKL